MEPGRQTTYSGFDEIIAIGVVVIQTFVHESVQSNLST